MNMHFLLISETKEMATVFKKLLLWLPY